MALEPRIRVSALLRWEDRILLCRHEKAGRGEYWLLPGGGVNSGESLLDALHRELAEEVGVGDDLTFEGPIALVDSISPKRTFSSKHVVHIIFAGDLSGARSRRSPRRTRRCAGTASSTPASWTGSRSTRRSSASSGAGCPATRRCTSARSGRPNRRGRHRPSAAVVWRPASARGRLGALPPLKRVSIQGYRAARELAFEPGSVCALVGEASSGKSTVLTAIWTLLEAAAPPPTIDDVSRETAGERIHLEADVGAGTIFLDARPPDTLNLNRAGAPPVLFLPANLRSRTMAAPATGRGASDVAELLRPPSADHHWAAADGGLQLITGMEKLLASNLRRFVLLIEEPELYLSPHAQRHLYRVLRDLAQQGNQILYSTHAPVFLSVDRLEELALVRHTHGPGTTLLQPNALAEAESFRALSEFDSDRAELFLARCALLVEGRTEKMTFPLVFDALGVDVDREGILVLECGGKGNIPLFARICNACDVPYVVVHDRDAERDVRPVESERIVNRQIREVAGKKRTVVLTPDFEAVSGVRSRSRNRKPRKALRRYRSNAAVPEPLKVAVEKVLRAARE